MSYVKKINGSNLMTRNNFFEQIIWENRFKKALEHQKCFVSLDGTDFRILEPYLSIGSGILINSRALDCGMKLDYVSEQAISLLE